MRRLREEKPASDPAIARLAAMAKAARPLERSHARQERVRAALARQGRAKKATPRRAMVLRPAVVLIASLGSVAIAGAVLGRVWVELKRSAHHRALVAPRTQLAVPALPTPGLAAPAPAPARVAERVVSMAWSVSSHAAPPQATAPVAIDPPSAPPLGPVSASHEAAMVAAAVKVLRGDQDAKRAHDLFEEYLREYPQGLLAEEALALAVEAAGAHDDPQAARLGTEYLRRYPTGRFRGVAEQARQRFSH